jgi:uncharacterized membrane protein
MPKPPIKSETVQLSLAAVFTALVFVATTVFSVYVPQTRGFFNIGEIMVFATALLLGPVIGAFAGGVGSMLADIALGYWYYAPATLVIKACEGGLVGLISRRKPSHISETGWQEFTFRSGLVLGILVGSIGSIYYSGSIELYLGFPPAVSPSLTLLVPKEIWYVLGALILVAFALAGLAFEPEFGWLTFTVLLGGMTMVAGYFLYQQFIIGPLFGIAVIAVAEIPINIGQMLIGLVVSIPIVKTVWRSIPSLKT